MISKEIIKVADGILRERIGSVLKFDTAVGYRLLPGTYEIAEEILTTALSSQWRGMESAELERLRSICKTAAAGLRGEHASRYDMAKLLDTALPPPPASQE